MELDWNDLIDDRILVIMQEDLQWPELKEPIDIVLIVVPGWFTTHDYQIQRLLMNIEY